MMMRFAVVVAFVIAVCAASCADHPWPYQKNTLKVGEAIVPGQSLETATALLEFVATGQIGLFKKTPRGNKLIWSTGNATVNSAQFMMQKTGVITLLEKGTGRVLWSSPATTGNVGTIAVLQDDCNFVIYEAAPQTNETWSTNTQMCINVHIVPHSHDDVGWLLSPERYFDGCHTPWGGVQSIIGTMVDALSQNPNRTFAEVEMYFFNRWWNQQDAATQEKARTLIKNGQFDLVNAGWSMHDEACVHQESAIFNMAEGAQWLREEFGNTFNISVGWHIDPFGHASATPRLMSQMGFDAFFFWRTDYEHKNFMQQTKTFETMWLSSPSLGPSVSLFTSIMYQSYCMGCQTASGGSVCPDGFCCMTCELQDNSWKNYFDVIKARGLGTTKIDKMQKEFHSTATDITTLAQDYVNWIKQYANYFRTNNVLIPWGCDFEHIAATMSFDLMDQIFAVVNGDDSYGVNMFYSTPERYIKSVSQMNYSWPINKYDYFLDSDNGQAYWSGYFSSRSAFKGFERFLMNEETSTELIMSATPKTSGPLISQVDEFRQAMGVAQHHDCITGTEREHVRDRYQDIMYQGWASANGAVSQALKGETGADVNPCLLANLSSCDLTNPLASGKNVSVYVFNPVAWSRSDIITIPVSSQKLAIVAKGKARQLACQLSPTWVLTTSPDPTSPNNTAQPFEILCRIVLEPLELVELVIVPATTNTIPFVGPKPGVTKIQSEFYAVEFDTSTGQIANVTNLQTGQTSPIAQNIYAYCPMGNQPNQQPSGAYIFRTCSPTETPQVYQTKFQASALVGPVCSEVRQIIDGQNLLHQTVRVCLHENYVDLLTGLGPVQTGSTGVEVIMKVTSDVKSNGVYYTDSQGLEMERRVRNQRPNYPYTLSEPIASNYFPSSAFAMLNDTFGKSIALTTDRSRATASLQDGELEFLVLRRLLFDDHRGVGQPLNEDIRIITHSRMIVNAKDMVGDLRVNSALQTHKAILRFGGPSTTNGVFRNFLNFAPLPSNVHLHTRSLLKPGVLLVRLQHLFAVGEGPSAVPSQVKLSTILPVGAKMTTVTEMDMNGIVPLSELKRVQFDTCDAATGVVSKYPTTILPSLAKDGNTVTLNPMDIRTFIVEFTD